MKRLRFGIVGLGPRGRDLLRLTKLFDYVDFVAACDIKTSNWYEKTWENDLPLCEMYPAVELFTDYDTMLCSANLDVVMVETGADIHCEFCCKALEKDINVISDIPLVANLEEAEKIWKAAEKSKATIIVGANPNYSRYSQELYKFYKDGFLGEPYCMEAEYIHWSLPQSDERKQLTANGNWRKLLIPIRYCTHSLGPLLRIVDEELRYVSCFGTGNHGHIPDDFKKDDMQCAQFRTESGVVIRIMRNGRCRAKIGAHNLRVFGSEGYFERIDRFHKPVIRYNSMKIDDNQLTEVEGRFMPKDCYIPDEAIRPEFHDGMDYVMLDEFYNALANDLPAPISVKDGLLLTLPGIYAEYSAKQGGRVLKMKYPWDKDWSTEVEAF